MPRAAVALAALLVAVAPASATPDLSSRDRGDLAVRAREILRRHCAECHGEKPRRGDVSVLDHAKMTAPAYPVPLVNPADPPRSLLLEFVRDGSMPPGGRPRPGAADVKVLTDWVAAGAPGYPRAFGDGYAADAAFADWTARPDADKPHLRYLSFAHLVRDGAAPTDLRAGEAKARAALRAGAGKNVELVPADPPATVFRLDLRAAGWDRGDLFDRTGAKSDAHPLTGFDVVLLEYPHAATTSGSDAAAKMAAGLKGVRRVPVVRADWLADALAPNAPLTTDVRALADIAPGKEACGPRPGLFFASPAAPGRPLEAWHSRDPEVGAFPVTAEVVTGPAFDAPSTEVPDRAKFRLRVTTDRPVRVRVLRVLADGDTRVQPIERDALPAGTTLLGPRTNTPFAASVTGGDAATDYYVVFASETDVPMPTILRSRHLQLCDDPTKFPLWRFLFEPTDPKFDPARIVRRVVPLTVRK